jgi:thiamine biosynthesis lipoprotein ApbE
MVHRRLRPLMGTFVEIQIHNEFPNEDLANEFFNSIFDHGLSLEKIFNRFDSNSAVSLYRAHQESTNPLLGELLEISQRIAEISSGAFSSVDPSSSELDLNGIAKGFVVDQLVEFVLRKKPDCMGAINAGGDLRFFNSPTRTAQLRLGDFANPVFRDWQLKYDAVATSAMNRSMMDERSSTTYHRNSRAALGVHDSVVVSADHCCIADALTKVGLFAEPKLIQACSTAFQASTVVFDALGNPLEIYAPQSQT